jgi:hypothetical protein
MATAKLSVILAEVKGKVGNSVFTRSPQGTVLRPYTVGTDPKTPAQIARRAAIAKAADAWNSLSPQQVSAWREYAESIIISTDLTGVRRSPVPYNAFSALASKILQINPDAAIPALPPTGDFDPDPIALEAEPVPGGIRFTPSEPNQQNSTTEILLQKLPSQHRKPINEKYRSKSFVRFENTDPVTVPTTPGVYALAYRLANPQTGQQTQLIPLNTITVA